MITVLSLFDGIATARYVLEQLGVPVQYYASEVDKYAISITAKNYPDIQHLGDVRHIDSTKLGKIDLLIGGFPCQDLSIAKNNRQGLQGERSALFYEMLRIHKETKPKYFVYENVASMAKDQKELITQAISEVEGRRIEPVLINAALVSAQSRKRLFWTNIDVPQPEDRGILLKDILEDATTETPKARTIDGNYSKGTGGRHLRSYEVSPKTLESIKGWNQAQAGRIRGIDGKSVTLQAGGGGTGAKTGLYKVPIKLASINSGGQGDRIYSTQGKSVTISSTSGGTGDKTGLYAVSMVQEQTIIRKLTPVECERLQSLPDNYTAGVSNTQRYKALGNAFNAEVIKHILRQVTWN